jgi:hypothetical protein
MGACNLRVVTGRGGLGLSCLAEGRNCRSGTEVADDHGAQQAAGRALTGEILALPNRRNTYNGALVRGRSGAVDKLGMMRCVVCQAGLSGSGAFSRSWAAPANAVAAVGRRHSATLLDGLQWYLCPASLTSVD